MFQVDTNGECLLCQEKCDILYRPGGDPRQVSSSTAFRILLSYLNVNERNLNEISSRLRRNEDLNGADLLISLCSPCISVTTQFVERFAVFEDTCRELNNSYQELHDRIKKGFGSYKKSREQGTKENCVDESNSRIAKRLREETLDKCTSGLGSSQPILALVGGSSSKEKDVERSAIKIRVIKISAPAESDSDSNDAMDSFRSTTPYNHGYHPSPTPSPSIAKPKEPTTGTPPKKNKSKKKRLSETESSQCKCPYPQCGKVLSRRDHLLRHIRNVHPHDHNNSPIVCQPRSDNPGKFQCSHCGSELNHQNDLDGHIQAVHSKDKADCVHCHKTFSRPEHLNRHLMMQHPLQRFSNEFSWKPTKNQFFTALDKVIARTEKTRVGDDARISNKCPQCEKSFFDVKTLKIHVLQLHFDQVLWQLDLAREDSIQNGEDVGESDHNGSGASVGFIRHFLE